MQCNFLFQLVCSEFIGGEIAALEESSEGRELRGEKGGDFNGGGHCCLGLDCCYPGGLYWIRTGGCVSCCEMW